VKESDNCTQFQTQQHQRESRITV